MHEIDARGDKCPVPVVKARNALKAMREGEALSVRVDNVIATQNLGKMAGVLGFTYDVQNLAGDDYIVKISKNGGAPAAVETPVKRIASEKNLRTIGVISSNVMGAGDDKLGEALMKAFIFALSQQDDLPDTLLFYNGGVKLTTVGSPVLDDLRKMRDMGVTLFSCGACLNFYELSDKLEVGEVTNMYDIVGMMAQADRVIRP